jgi:signal transduction histidine kinase
MVFAVVSGAADGGVHRAFFTFVNLCGVKWVMRLAMPIATASAILAFLSAVIPIYSGSVNWQQAFTFHLTVPFDGWFGQMTSVMAGLYLIGFAAPAFEQAACHVGETINPDKNVPRAMFASAGLASLYFIILPIVWLGALGPEPLGNELAVVLGPTFAPLLGGAAKATAIWFMIFNMLHGPIAALAGSSRTLAQLSEDGLLPRFLAKRTRTDAPWAATLLTAGMAIAFLLIGDPIWLIAAANLTYLIGIALPNVAVWLLRHNEPHMARPFRAPRRAIILGLFAASAWGLTAILGFEQFGLPTVLVGIAFAYSGAILYSWRKFSDRRKMALPGIARTLHLKLTGAMVLVLVLDVVGYLLAVKSIPMVEDTAQITIIEDIFVVVALLTLGVGLILPGMIAHSAVEVSKAAEKLVKGTLADFTRAMQALAAGDLNGAKAHFDFSPVVVHSRDEVGDMALNFNKLQEEIGRAAVGLEGARAGLLASRTELTKTNERLGFELVERKLSEIALEKAHKQLVEVSRQAGMAEVATSVLHNVGNVLNSVNVTSSCLAGSLRNSKSANLSKVAKLLQEHERDLGTFLTSDPKGTHLPGYLAQLAEHLAGEQTAALEELAYLQKNIEHIKDIVSMQQSFAKVSGLMETLQVADIMEDALRMNSTSLVRHKILVIREFENVSAVTVEKHKVLQILVNLVRNATECWNDSGHSDKRLTLRISNGNGHVHITITDNGIGIPAENLTRVFAHGFTTKSGHGFGLHSSALAANEMNGSLGVSSDGLGQGATFTLELPYGKNNESDG